MALNFQRAIHWSWKTVTEFNRIQRNQKLCRTLLKNGTKNEPIKAYLSDRFNVVLDKMNSDRVGKDATAMSVNYHIKVFENLK